MSEVRDRVVLVTGATRGIGAAVVGALVARGVRVGCGYHTSLAAAEAMAVRWPGQVFPVRYALGDAASAREAIDSLTSAYGRLDAVVANAGVWAGGRLERIDESEWSRVVADNLNGVAQLSRAALPHLMQRPTDTSITILSSVVGVIGGAGDTAYATAKAGLFGFSYSLAKEVAPEGIRVNVVAPGFVETEMTSKVSQRSREAIISSTLLGRFGRAEEVAAAVVYLSEDATYCTGSTLTVDGGWSR